MQTETVFPLRSSDRRNSAAGPLETQPRAVDLLPVGLSMGARPHANLGGFHVGPKATRDGRVRRTPESDDLFNRRPVLCRLDDTQPPIRMSRSAHIKDELTRFGKGQRSSRPATAAGPQCRLRAMGSAERRSLTVIGAGAQSLSMANLWQALRRLALARESDLEFATLRLAVMPSSVRAVPSAITLPRGNPPA